MSHSNQIPEQNLDGKGKPPAFQLYPGDLKRDVALQTLDPLSKLVWYECLFLMHDTEERGVLVMNGKPMTDAQIARAINLDNQIVTKALTEIKASGVCSVREDGAIYCRRMVRDEAIRQKRIKAGFMGGNPNLLKQNLTKGQPNTQPHVNQNTEDEDEDLNLKKNSQPPGPPLEQRGKHLRMTPADWQKLENEFGNALKTELPEADRWIEDNKTCDKNARKYARSGHNHYLFFRGWLKRNVESVPKIAHSNGHNPPPRPQPPPFKPPKQPPPPTPEQRAQAKKLTSEFFERVKNEH